MENAILKSGKSPDQEKVQKVPNTYKQQENIPKT